MTQIPTWNSPSVNPLSGRTAPGTMIGGRYTLRAAVGHGGMGTVWRAADTLLRRDVAVKEVVLPPGLAPSDRDAMYERTLREARAAAALQHPAVVQVYDVVHESGRPWIVMELLDARSLADMVIEDGPLAPRAVAKIGIALLGALEVAHAIGVLHRDVKPANVLICSDGRCVLTDFGVARMPTDVQLTTPGMVLGSPHFISPERAMGLKFGPPSDLFSLGVTLYTAVEGRPPFDKGDPIETMHAVVEEPPAPPVRCGPLSRVLFGLLEKAPERRLDVKAARGMLRDLLSGPLASKAAGQSVTDPYAVVPSTVAAAQPPATQPQPSGQIGGRAMLAPGESLTDRLAALRQESATRAGQPAWDQPTGLAGGPPPMNSGWSAGAGPADHTAPIATPVGWGPAGGAADRTAVGGQPPGGPVWVSGGNQAGPDGHWGTGAGTPGGKPGGPLNQAGAALRRSGAQLAGTVRGWPRRIQLAAAGGVAVVLLVGIVALWPDGDKATRTPQASGTTPAAQPAVPTQQYQDRGLSVNVPEGWTRTAAGVWVDYTDPEDKGRKVRILVEDFKNVTAMRWAEVAENNLKNPKSKSCPKPYTRVDLSEVELAGQTAAQLEYTCGEGDGERHGVWRGMAINDKIYSFYLTTTDANFAESKPIFDEMVRSFELDNG
ncbi:serine/threonine-protein kinase [Plantactinospora sp. KBS50]|uniref:serine/threonine-protein kinase n=1 Tax=Plantactinospora sp. KBS50 TaxID=2024580 RepID=UPI000BAAC6AA|nr:serine/threonine-protein kinase [Plantactinospora sp. KBS50]ASW56717.1 protein kinase [Plantactinospora sp. KBS50]